MSYHEEEKRDLTIRLRKLLRELPEFCYEYFRGIEPTTAERTRLGYAHDLRIFFQFLLEEERSLEAKTMQEIQISDLTAITPTKLEMFLDYVTYYDRDGEELQNGEKGKARKINKKFNRYF